MMKKILFSIAFSLSVLILPTVFILPSTASAAIAFDASSQGSNNGTNSLTVSHTVTGSNTILWCFYWDENGDDISGITFNSVSMTQVQKRAGAAGWESYLYMLIAPATGTHNIVASRSSSSLHVALHCASYTGASQVAQPDASTANNASGVNTLTTSVTTVANNSWTVLGGFVEGNMTAPGGSATIRGSAEFGAENIIDSNSPVSPAGSASIVINGTNVGNYVSVMASFSPASTYTAWDPLNKGANIDLTGNNLIATKNNNAWQSVRSVLFVPASTKCYWEMTLGNGFGSGAAPVVGIGNASGLISNEFATDANGWGLSTLAGVSGSLTGARTNNATNSYGVSTLSNGDTVGVRFDSGAGTLGFIANDGTDIGDAFTGLATANYYAYGAIFGTGASWTANFGASAFAHPIPSGYSACLTTAGGSSAAPLRDSDQWFLLFSRYFNSLNIFV